MIAPEPEKGAPGKTVKFLTVFESDERNAMKVAIHKARLILKYKPVIAAEVLSGMLQLDAAYKTATRV